MRWKIASAVLGVYAVLLIVSNGCGSKSGGDSNYSIPAITPQVKAATPTGFGGTASKATFLLKQVLAGVGTRLSAAPTLTGAFTTGIRSNFFGGPLGQGPTQIFALLPGVDERFSEINSTSTSCLGGTPVTYTINPAGASAPITMYAQCYRTVSGQNGATGFTNPAGITDPQFFMLGYVPATGVYYLYTAVGASWLAAIETPISGSGSAAQYSVHLWTGVGYGNGASGSSDGQCGTVGAWDKCSYGVMELLAIANATTSGIITLSQNFEFTASGINMGYCGVQIVSDGNNIYAMGSVDSGGCQTPTSACFPASSTSATTDTGGSCPSGQTCANGCTVTSTCSAAAATAGICIAPQSSGFALTPLGRNASTGSAAGGSVSYAASAYPGGSNDNVTLAGTTSDSLYFSTGPAIAGNSTFSTATSPCHTGVGAGRRRC